MTDQQTIKAIQALSWEVRQDQATGDYQAFFRGFPTAWRMTLEEVLADIQEIQKPTEEK